MTAQFVRMNFTAFLCLTSFSAPALAADPNALPIWKPDSRIVAELGEVFSDSHVRIRPAPGFVRCDVELDPKLEDAGLRNYGWSPTGSFPNTENMTVVFTPFAKPSSDALDKSIAGMKDSIEKNLQNAKFGKTRRGRFLGNEARAGRYFRVHSWCRDSCFLSGLD